MTTLLILLAILWLLIGFLSFTFSKNAWRVYWYKKFNEHYNESKYYDDELDEIIFFTLFGLISFIVISIDGFNPKSKYYYPNSLWMIRYDKNKVEKKFKK